MDVGDSRLRGNDGKGRAGNDGRLALPLWIAGQVRDDGEGRARIMIGFAKVSSWDSGIFEDMLQHLK